MSDGRFIGLADIPLCFTFVSFCFCAGFHAEYAFAALAQEIPFPHPSWISTRIFFFCVSIWRRAVRRMDRGGKKRRFLSPFQYNHIRESVGNDGANKGKKQQEKGYARVDCLRGNISTAVLCRSRLCAFRLRYQETCDQLGEAGWIQSGNFIVTGLFAFLAAVGMRRLLRGSWSGMWGGAFDRRLRSGDACVGLFRNKLARMRVSNRRNI
ncbi:DUF998 domain-containing protein [Xylanibacillus composti]|nr:DUF998 domain-containing protein [Xylanibacillus composti]